MAKSARKWRRRTPEQWRELLERQAASGQSVEAFCRAESVTTASFYRWRKQLGAQGAMVPAPAHEPVSAAPSFVDLGTLGDGDGDGDGAASGGWELELALGGGVVLRLRGN